MCLCSFFAAKDYEMEIIWQASRNPSPFREKIFGIGSSLQGEVSGLERACVCVCVRGWRMGWLVRKGGGLLGRVCVIRKLQRNV